MPTGKVKFYNADKGFGFIGDESGADVFLGAAALPEGVTSLRAGTRLEYSIVQGRKGSQAMHVQVLDAPPSVQRGRTLRDRKPADEMAVVVEDLIRLLDDASNQLRAGRYPDTRHGTTLAKALRAVADQFEAGR
ncbi:cold-shock DNA-binding protein family [Kytococcus aerolatus]|uniref:Cold-shock DNA-binding protein family n=1 Tax=Kytococcus aerolatus TaxID=592308 RepID=A0A212TCR4_9MICO|nr:cold shock domain-containing protein [Kytococcus aerolatus]SNC63813.1 cold-shock DNA-binding protein family [Kytococcus aerolatus]